MKEMLIILYVCLVCSMQTLCVFAEDANSGNSTIHSYSQFRNYFLQSGNAFAETFQKMINLAWAVGLILLAMSFVMLMIGLAVNAGKLGTYTNEPKKRQEAYEGFLHFAIDTALLGAAPLILGSLLKFFTGFTG